MFNWLFEDTAVLWFYKKRQCCNTLFSNVVPVGNTWVANTPNPASVNISLSFISISKCHCIAGWQMIIYACRFLIYACLIDVKYQIMPVIIHYRVPSIHLTNHSNIYIVSYIIAIYQLKGDIILYILSYGC